MATITDKGMQARATDRDVWINEAFARGGGVFVGRITPAGGRSFYFRYVGPGGKRTYRALGNYSARGDGGLTVAQARAAAADLSALYRSGVVDLAGHFAQIEADEQQAAELERQRIAEELRQREAAALAESKRLTVRQLFERWQTTELRPRVVGDGQRMGRKDGGAQCQSQFERYLFPTHGDRAVEELTRADYLAVVDAALTAGHQRLAAVLYADMRQMASFALARDILTRDPFAGLKRSRIVGKPVKRDRVLSDAEIAALPAAIAASNMRPRSAAALWLILATGARLGEAMGAVWAQALPSNPKERAAALADLQELADVVDVKLGIVDVHARTWHLPDTKNQRDHTIHLSKFAVTQLEALQTMREPLPPPAENTLSPWVFAATDTRQPVCPASLGKQLADRQRTPDRRMTNRTRATEALVLEGGRWTAHDLRRTAATIMARLGFSTDVVNECLNHKQADAMAQVYIRDRRENEQRTAFDALGEHLQTLLKGKA